MGLRLSSHKPAFANAFEQQFALETLKSEKLRVTILLGAWMGSFLLMVFLFLLFNEQFQATFHGRFNDFAVKFLLVATLTATALYLERLAIGRVIRKKQEPSTLLRYVSAFIETSIPTIGILVANQFLGSFYGL